MGNTLLAAAGMKTFWVRFGLMLPITTAASVAAGWVFFALVDRRFTNLPVVGRFNKWVKPREPGVALPHAQV